MSYDQNNAGIHMVQKHENWNTGVNEKSNKYRMLNGESLVSKRAVYLSKGYIKTQVANNDPNRKNVIKNKYKGLIGKKDEHYLYGKGIIISQDQAKPEKGQGAFCQL